MESNPPPKRRPRFVKPAWAHAASEAALSTAPAPKDDALFSRSKTSYAELVAESRLEDDGGTDDFLHDLAPSSSRASREGSRATSRPARTSSRHDTSVKPEREPSASDDKGRRGWARREASLSPHLSRSPTRRKRSGRADSDDDDLGLDDDPVLWSRTGPSAKLARASPPASRYSRRTQQNEHEHDEVDDLSEELQRIRESVAPRWQRQAQPVNSMADPVSLDSDDDDVMLVEGDKSVTPAPEAGAGYRAAPSAGADEGAIESRAGPGKSRDMGALVSVLVMSDGIPNTSPLIVNLRMNNTIQDVRTEWLKQQAGLAEHEKGSILFTFRGRRVYDVQKYADLPIPPDQLAAIVAAQERAARRRQQQGGDRAAAAAAGLGASFFDNGDDGARAGAEEALFADDDNVKLSSDGLLHVRLVAMTKPDYERSRLAQEQRALKLAAAAASGGNGGGDGGGGGGDASGDGGGDGNGNGLSNPDEDNGDRDDDDGDDAGGGGGWEKPVRLVLQSAAHGEHRVMSRPAATMAELLDSYCGQHGGVVEVAAAGAAGEVVRLVVDGEMLPLRSTVREHELEDMDMLEVHLVSAAAAAEVDAAADAAAAAASAGAPGGNQQSWPQAAAAPPHFHDRAVLLDDD